MITNANEILFRSSSLGYLFTEGKDKSNLDKYLEAKARLVKYTEEYNGMFNKGTKAAALKHSQILKANTDILQLESIKDDFTPSETCRKQLLRVYAQAMGRREELKNKYLEKGNYRENDSITLLSLVSKRFYKKNTQRLYNEYIQGEPDLFEGESIYKADHTLDTKSSWSYITFLESQVEEINTAYEWQGHGYMFLSGAKKHTICYCLVNGTFKYINDQVRALGWKHGILDGDVSDDEDYLKSVKQLERNHIFDIDSFMKENRDYRVRNDVVYDSEKDKYFWEYDIPKEERVYTKTFYRDEEKINLIKKMVPQWRSYMNKKYFKIAA